MNKSKLDMQKKEMKKNDSKNKSKTTKEKTKNKDKTSKQKIQKISNKDKHSKQKINKETNIKKKDTNKKSNINQKNTKKITYKDFTIDEIEQELKREKYKNRYVKVLMSTIYTLIIVASVAALIATLIMPVLQISGSSMNPTLKDTDIVLSIKTTNIEKNEIIAFYHGNKILVKRVIGKSGDWVNIDKDGNVYINNILLEEPYINQKYLGEIDIKFPYQVPESTYFVLGDDRKTSVDSRNSIIGVIKQEDIIGKVIFRVWPIKKIGTIN